MTSGSSSRLGRPKDAAKREEIVAAATRLFLDRGYALTSMETVAKEAGVSKLTIYSHFSDKKELFCAIMQQRCVEAGMPRDFMALASLPPGDALRQIAARAATLIFAPESLRLQRTVYAEAAHHPEIVETFYAQGPRRVKAGVAELLADYNRRNLLCVPDCARATEQFFSLVKGERLLRALMMIAPPPDACEIEDMARDSTALFLAAYATNERKSS